MIQQCRKEDLPRLAIRPYPEQYVTTWKLRSGTPITIRPIRPEDEPLMVKFHSTLSEESVHFRYFGLLKLEQRTTHERLTRICFNDYDREIAIVANSPIIRIERRGDHRDWSTNQGPWGERGRICNRRERRMPRPGAWNAFPEAALGDRPAGRNRTYLRAHSARKLCHAASLQKPRLYGQLRQFRGSYESGDQIVKKRRTGS